VWGFVRLCRLSLGFSSLAFLTWFSHWQTTQAANVQLWGRTITPILGAGSVLRISTPFAAFFAIGDVYREHWIGTVSREKQALNP
jgi:hypothetical protein